MALVLIWGFQTPSAPMHVLQRKCLARKVKTVYKQWSGLLFL
jgi:hypothetical protein